ncbi:Dynamin-related GTPase protein [Marasmius tenuissimus]|uniref:Dynamin-related GTPase protein n=1 Tax=Marasmius tenuissimus TaxID=585030 RepID=A0ABR2ZMR7_9AGAR
MSLESSGVHTAGAGGAPRLSAAKSDVDPQCLEFGNAARQVYCAGGPVGSRVRGAQHAGALGGEEEIPPTYDSLVGLSSPSPSGSGRGDRKEKGAGLRVTNDSDEGVGGSGSVRPRLHSFPSLSFIESTNVDISYYVFNDIFGAAIDAIKADGNLNHRDIRTANRDSSAAGPSLFVPEIAFELLVKPQIKLS